MKIHLMGNMGSGAKAVSYLASKYGYDVTGCDIQKEGHDIGHIKDVDMVVVSPALLYSDNPPAELVEAKKQGKLLTWEEFVGKYLMKDKFVIAVSGTHGKSTTTAMIGLMLEDCGFDPTVLVGAYVPRWGANARYGKSKYFVVEADEFNDNFLHYKPDLIVVNNIEFDHPDYFKDEAQVRESFAKFIKNLKPGGDVLEKPGSIKFNLKVFGQHNQINANMAFLVGEKLGIKKELIINSIENFNGIGRRMELLGKFGNTEVYSDYAHHPSAIKTTLKGLREAYPDKKILALIEPHGYKRTKALLPLYSGIFDSVDTVIVGPIFKARDMIDNSVSPEDIAKVSGHTDINTINEIDKLKINKNQFDVIVIMGAGNSNLWAKHVIACLGGITFKDLTTIKTGGKIKHFIRVSSDQEVVDAVAFAKKNKLNIFIIGEGSDILVSDNAFDGVVIKHVGNNYQISKELVTADAGMTWDKLVEICVKNNLQGIENLSGIPGTVGAAPIQNIGAYGAELKDVFVSLKAYDIENENFVTFNKLDCEFGYRESIFKSKKYWQKFIICSITLKLTTNGKPNSNYESLNKFLKSPEKASISDIREAVIKVRSQKLEDWRVIPNAGSFFKNPIISKEQKEFLENKYSDIKVYPFGDKYKTSAGYMIEKVGLKGFSMGKAKVSDKHALIITNPQGEGRFEDIYKLAKMIEDTVYKEFGIKLEPEVQYINL